MFFLLLAPSAPSSPRKMIANGVEAEVNVLCVRVLYSPS